MSSLCDEAGVSPRALSGERSVRRRDHLKASLEAGGIVDAGLRRRKPDPVQARRVAERDPVTQLLLYDPVVLGHGLAAVRQLGRSMRIAGTITVPPSPRLIGR